MHPHRSPSASQPITRSPFDTLPLELKQEIFMFSASYIPRHMVNDDLQGSLPDFEPAAVNISHTCREWRALAWATQGMWSWMIIHKPTKRSVQSIKHYLLRAEDSQGLCIYFRSSMPSILGLEAKTHFETIFNLWLTRVQQWSSINFEFSLPFESNLLLEVDPSLLLRLKQAHVTLDHFSVDRRLELWKRIGAAPSLVDISIGGDSNFDLPHWALEVPFFGHLTRIFITPEVTIVDFTSFLSLCKQVQYLGLFVRMEKELEINLSKTSQVVDMLSLNELSLWGWSADSSLDCGHLLNRIRAPQLQFLELLLPTKDHGSLGRLLSRSACSLQTLDLLGKLESCTLRGTAHPDVPFSAAALPIFTPKHLNGQMMVPFPSLLKLLIVPIVVTGASSGYGTLVNEIAFGQGGIVVATVRTPSMLINSGKETEYPTQPPRLLAHKCDVAFSNAGWP
ncbi:hypothetical protein BDN72DRAFT_862326 [Pluteus cervinus]|uniref:Uncharacterized protein n=1 Tax=Pluteus cervinus TaxID=181527 RepID=A0ACD3AC25_9AGAR|nr:hypothetical protein BDN72DRAFT_862326 [Pluteus cervinus]